MLSQVSETKRKNKQTQIDCNIEDTEFNVNPVQDIPLRSAVYSVFRCEEQVIGFEFVSKRIVPKTTTFCNNIAVNLCVPVEIVNSIPLEKVEFFATDDPCFKDWIIHKIEEPSIEMQTDSSGNTNGILVRFFKDETCCFPGQMAFRLYGYDRAGCRFSLSTGLLVFK